MTYHPPSLSMDLRTAAATVPLPEGPAGDFLARAYIGKMLEAAPNQNESFQSWCQSAGSTTILRVRDAWLFSSVGILWDGAGVPGAFSARLYAQNLGAADTVLGTLTEWETNMRNSGKMDGDQRFIAKSHGFRCLLRAPGAGDEVDAAARINFVVNNVAAIFSTGSETRQVWGPIVSMPLAAQAVVGAVGILAAGAQPATLDSVPVSAPGIHETDPPIILEPNETFGVELRVSSLGLPSGGDHANAAVVIQHQFIGRTMTLVDG